MIKEKRTKRTKRSGVKAPSKQRLLEQTQINSPVKTIKKPLQEEDFSCSSDSTMIDVATAMVTKDNLPLLPQYHEDVLSMLARTSEAPPSPTPSSKSKRSKTKKSKSKTKLLDNKPARPSRRSSDTSVTSKSSTKSDKSTKSKKASKKKKKPKRDVKNLKVSFATPDGAQQGRGRVKSLAKRMLSNEVFTPPPVKATFMQIERCEDPEEIWWQERDMRSFRQRNSRLVDRLQENDDFIWAVETIHRSHDEKKITEEAFNEAFFILTKIASGKKDPRGLELHVACDTARRQIEKHREAVMTAVQQSGRTCDKPNDAANWVRKESKTSSKASRVFAAALADYDAQEAAVVYTTS